MRSIGKRKAAVLVSAVLWGAVAASVCLPFPALAAEAQNAEEAAEEETGTETAREEAEETETGAEESADMEKAEPREASSEIVYFDPVKTASRLPVSSVFFENPFNPYESLKVPAQITRQGPYYFIADCYHDQVIYTKNPGAPVREWKVMTTDVSRPHGVAGDGQVYLVVDTENDRVQIFEWKNGRFQNTQRLENIGRRPHYIVYDKPTASFFIWSSLTGEMYIARRDPQTGTVYVPEVRKIKELDGFYVRSFTIAGDCILFPSGNNCYIIIADKDTLEVQARFGVTPEISGMAYIVPIGGYFYMTVSSDLDYDQSAATMIRSSQLWLLSQGIYEDVYGAFPERGIPYYIDFIDGMYYMTDTGSGKTVWRFQVSDDKIINVGGVY